jgi:putative transposase
MAEKFRNKYRISSARLKNWDYRSDGAYFITLCTHNREWFFGKIVNKKFIGNPVGRLAEKYWSEIPKHFPFVELGNFVVMPNHVHGILIINKSKIGNHYAAARTDTETVDGTNPVIPHIVNPTATINPTVIPVTIPKNEKMADISPKSGAISTIIRSYKSVVSKHAHLINSNFNW